ncbi:MAG: TIGR03960 family B12-binding radical SAM protein [Planctomycetia bacterium]|nr:TIGR03960 family B12-binding radical SAM protein [Planctomycetia bacterium]
MSDENSLWDSMGKVGFVSGSSEAQEGEDLTVLPDKEDIAHHPYKAFLHRLEKPGRYTGGELHSVKKTETRLSFLLAFPDVYEIGMSHLGFKILYSQLNDLEDVSAERVYSPWIDCEKELRTRELELVSLETWKRMRDFDVVGFSLQYELTFTNVLTMLDLGQIPIRSEDRDDDCPLVMAGGPVAFQPEPMSAFIDAFLIGDGEGHFHKVVDHWKTLKEQGLSRRDRLIAISQFDGVYVPSLYSTKVEPDTGFTVVDAPLDDRVPASVTRAHVPDLSEFPFPSKSPVPNTEVVFDRASIEVARGCTEGCRFCQAGMIYRPVRERPPEDIQKVVRDAVKCGGFDEVSLTSLSTADYSAIEPLVKKIMPELREKNISLSVSSLRAYGLTDEMLEEMSSVRNTSLTFAPEAGTQRMRDVVNKNITEEDIAKSAHRIFSRGWRRMKLYFMIGLPTEDDSDIRGIAETGKRMLDIAREYLPKGRAQVTVSVSSHVPKPFTPFQWAAMDDLPDIEEKHDVLRKLTRYPGLQLRWHDPSTSHLEGVLSRGDRTLSNVIETAWRKGCRFDGWSDRMRFDYWMESIEENEIDRYKFLGTIPVDARLPWDHIDCGVEPKFLVREYQRALKDRTSHPCGKPGKRLTHYTNVEDASEDKRRLVCYDCGIACDLSRMKEERIEYLDHLDATERKQGAESSQTDAGVEEVRAEAKKRFALRANPKLPPERKELEHSSHGYRIRYAKLGRARYMSHLDLNRFLPRAIRRAGFSPAYSRGFHPIPQMSFGPPLRLGMAGLSEVVDIKLQEDLPAEQVMEALAKQCPQGIEIRSLHALGKEAPKLSAISNWADFLIFIPREKADQISVEKVEAFLDQDEVLVDRLTKKGKPKVVDIRPGVGSIEWLEEVPADAEGYQVRRSDECLLGMRVCLQGDHLTKPEDVLARLFDGEMPAGIQVVRRRLLPAPSPRRTVQV